MICLIVDKGKPFLFTSYKFLPSKILKQLEKSHSSEELTDKMASLKDDDLQLSFFNLDDPLLEKVKEEITSLDINTLTPVEALMKLDVIKRMLTNTKKV